MRALRVHHYHGDVVLHFNLSDIPYLDNYVKLSFEVVVPTANAVLKFGFRNDPDYLYLDDASVQKVTRTCRNPARRCCWAWGWGWPPGGLAGASFAAASGHRRAPEGHLERPRAAAAIMRENKRGAIVNMSSFSGKVGLVGQTNYSAAKAGIVGMTKAAAKELAHLGVRVNAIQPGLIRSAMTEAMPQHIWDQKVAEVPMGRAGEPAEVAKVALFLASDLSSYMTGTVMEVTGGRLM